MSRRMTGPHVLFAPRGGRYGLGEHVRARALALALRQQRPDVRIGILVGKAQARLAEVEFSEGTFDAHRIERHSVPGWFRSSRFERASGVLADLTPDVVVFDNCGRDLLPVASGLGARTVFVTSQARHLQKVSARSSLRHLDQLWLVHRRFEPGRRRLTTHRLRVALAHRPLLREFDTLCPEPDPERVARLRADLGVGPAPYALFVAGGGGWIVDGRYAAEVFAEAALRVHEATGIECVVVMGPLYPKARPDLPKLKVVGALVSEDMLSLLSEASVVACGGGGLVLQALAAERATVAAGAGASDQPERVAACAAARLIEASELDARAIASRVTRLLEDGARADALRGRVGGSGFRNGIRPATAELERLLEPGC